MSERSIQAYDLPSRVADYDADMDVMHPNRHKMVQTALDVLPFDANTPLQALDLGIGTGFFSERLLRRFPGARVVGVDGARAMVDLAQARLRELAGRVSFRVGDFRDLAELLRGAGPFEVAFSAFALHHLGPADKLAVLRAVTSLLKPGGWFVNADILVSDSAELEERFQKLRCRGIVERSAGRDPRFVDVAATRRYLADMQAGEADQPLTLAEDLNLLRQAGFSLTTVLWLEYRECVLVGIRTPGANR